MGGTETDEILSYIVNILFVIIVLTVIISMRTQFLNQEVKTEGLENQIILEGFYTSEEGMIYQDPYTKQPHFGLIDLNKFEKINFSNIINTEKKNIAVRLILQLDNETLSRYYLSGKEDNMENFHEVMALSSYENRLTVIEEERPVRVWTEGKEINGALKLTVAQQK